jgi:putative component of membrane protein insertase Oxa1/YidC/SpoIIIJ protein YidD
MQKLLISLHLLFVFLLISSTDLFAQFSESDLAKIEKQDFHEHLYDKHKVRFLFADAKSPVIKYNPVSLTLGGLMYFYQAAISPQFAAGCLYETSCSNFSKLLISEYGIFKGMFTSADRLTRCTKLATLDINRLKINQKTGKVKEGVEIYKIQR